MKDTKADKASSNQEFNKLDQKPKRTRDKHKEYTILFEVLHHKWMIQSRQFKDEAVFNWFRKKDKTTALFLYHIFPTEYREATKRLKNKGTKLPNPSHSKYGNILKNKEFMKTLRALLKAARDTKRKSAWGRRHTPSAHLALGPFLLSVPDPSTIIVPAPAPISPVILPTVPQVATPRLGPELPVTHIPP